MYANPITADSYKFSHPWQFPPDTRNTYYYIESRGGAFDRTVFFGLQMWLKEYGIRRITQTDINQRADRMKYHGVPFYAKGFQRILDMHDGYMPLEIKAIPEGTVLPTSNALVTVEANDPECFWLPGFMETPIHRGVWYPTTTATLSYMCKQNILRYLELTCDDPAAVIPFALHDFGARGASSRETAGIGGAGHLVNFMGTDTVEALDAVYEYYGDPNKTEQEQMPAFSIPAMEHSTVTAWGRDAENMAFENMLNQFAKPGAIVACVSDSYDIYDAVEHIWGQELRLKVLNSGARIVVRPDSGEPTIIIPQLLDMLAKSYGATKNKKGYRVLNPAVRLIQGDGITYQTIPLLLEAITRAGYSTENVAFGMGAGLLQKVDRDTLRFAMKESAVQRGDTWFDAYKDPVTDRNKASKRGRLAVHSEEGYYMTERAEGNAWRDVLRTVFRNGKILHTSTFAEVRERALQPFRPVRE